MSTIVSQIMEIINNKKPFMEVEITLVQFMLDQFTDRMSFTLEQLDQQLKQEKQALGWKIERRAQRTMTYLFGPVMVIRSMMYDLRGKPRYPLDEVLEEAAGFPENREKPDYLLIEADGIHVGRKKRHTEIKQAIFYTDWEEYGKRTKLTHLTQVTSTQNIGAFWDTVISQILNRYDVTDTQIIYGSDGGADYTPNHLAAFSGLSKKPILAQLDIFHVKKAIRHALLKEHKELIPLLNKVVKVHDKAPLIYVLDTLESRAANLSEVEQNKIKDLRSYLLTNWERLIDWRNPGTANMAALVTGFANGTVKKAYINRHEEPKRAIQER